MENLLIEIQNAAKVIATPNCAAWISAIAAFCAVAVAVVVAFMQNKISQKQNEISRQQVEIAEQQNKIALFKERYLVYCELHKFFSACSLIKTLDTKNPKPLKDYNMEDKTVLLHAIEATFMIKLGIDFSDKQEYNSTKTAVILLSHLQQSGYQLGQVDFLFSGVEAPDIENMLSTWADLIGFLTIPNEPLNDADKKFVKSCEYVENAYLKVIENQLSLK